MSVRRKFCFTGAYGEEFSHMKSTTFKLTDVNILQFRSNADESGESEQCLLSARTGAPVSCFLWRFSAILSLIPVAGSDNVVLGAARWTRGSDPMRV